MKFTYKTYKYELWYILSEALLLHYRIEFMNKLKQKYNSISFWDFERNYVIEADLWHHLFERHVPKYMKIKALGEVERRIQKEDEAYRYIALKKLGLPSRTKLGQRSFHVFWEKISELTDFMENEGVAP